MPSGSLSTLGLALCVLACVPPARSDGVVVYATGFEAPDFSAGPFAGQGGWLTTASTFSSQGATVSTANVSSGSQAVAIDATYFPQADWFYRPLGFRPDANTQIVQISVDMFLTNTALNSGGWGIDCYDEANVRLGEFYVDPRGLAYISDGNTTTPAALAGRNVWTHFVFQLDYAQRLMSLSVNGAAPMVTVPLNIESGGTLGDADLHMFAAGTDTAYFDNYSVVAVPGPGGAVIAAGAVTMVWARRRRR